MSDRITRMKSTTSSRLWIRTPCRLPCLIHRSNVPEVRFSGPWLFLTAVLCLPLLNAGCATPGPQASSSIKIEGVEYSTCFEEVLLVARDAGMPPVLRDRAGGLVETSPRICGSIFEPWRQDNAGLAGGIENTIAFQRRRARFEFVPADFDPPPVADSERLTGPPMPGSSLAISRDLRDHEGPVELRVWVYIERSFRPGMQNPTWTRSMTTFSQDPLVRQRLNERGGLSDQSEWTPVRRDLFYENRLIEAFKKRIAKIEPT